MRMVVTKKWQLDERKIALSTNRVRVFEGTHVPLIFEQSLVPTGPDPDGLGPLSDVDRRLRFEFNSVCKREPGWRKQLKRLARELFDHQKYQLKNSHVIADVTGERADNMNIEDVCSWLCKLGALIPHNPDYLFDEAKHDCRYKIPDWVYDVCEHEGAYSELIARVRRWNDDGALESTPYPGDRAIDGDGNYPIVVPEPQPDIELLMLETPQEIRDFYGEPPTLTRSKSFTDYQWQKGESGNKRGRPRRLRETGDIDDERPHFFDTCMPAGSDGKSSTYGEAIYQLSRSRAVKDGDLAWLQQTDRWAVELDRIRKRRKIFANGGYAYNNHLEVTRIDIAIRHLELATILWPKSPSARWVINHWQVSAALERMKEGKLSREEMEGIYTRTRGPQHVDWPQWWPEDLRSKHNKNEQLTRPRRKISGTLTKA